MDPSLEEGDPHFKQALSTDTHITLAETAPLEDTQEEIIIQTDDSENVYEASMVDNSDLQGTVLHISDSDNMLDAANSIMGITKYEHSVYLTDSSDLETTASSASNLTNFIAPSDKDSNGLVTVEQAPVQPDTPMKLILLKDSSEILNQDNNLVESDIANTVIIESNDTTETPCETVLISTVEADNIIKLTAPDSGNILQEEVIVLGKLYIFIFVSFHSEIRLKC